MTAIMERLTDNEYTDVLQRNDQPHDPTERNVDTVISILK